MLGNFLTNLRRLEATDIWFYRRMLRIPWMEHVRNKEVSRKKGKKRLLALRIKKKQLKFLRCIIGKKGLANLILTEYTEVKKDRGKQ